MNELIYVKVVYVVLWSLIGAISGFLSGFGLRLQRRRVVPNSAWIVYLIGMIGFFSAIICTHNLSESYTLSGSIVWTAVSMAFITFIIVIKNYH
jgi:hypothetical protein